MKLDEASEVFLLGDANIDVLMPIDTFPQAGGDKRSERLVLEAGGSAANSAVAVARLGHHAHLISCCGIDPFGRIARDKLAAAGVDLSSVRTTAEDDTGLMFVPVTEAGQRTLFGRRGANRLLTEEDVPRALLSRADALHLSGYAFLDSPQLEAARFALAVASRAQVLISMDTAYEPPLVEPDSIRTLLPEIDLLILGAEEAAALSGREGSEAAAALRGLGAARVALKLGDQGCALFDENQILSIPAYRVKTVDTTGAGDAFSGALLAGLLWGLDFPSAAILASAAGALATTVWGAGPRSPHPKAILSLIQSQPTPPGLTPEAEAAVDLLLTLQTPRDRL